MNHPLFAVSLAVVGIVCSSSACVAAESQYARPELILQPSELSQPEIAQQFVVLDARSRDAYEKSRVPGARWVDHDAWSKAFGEGTDTEGWSQRIGTLGIGQGAKVVVYDDQAMKDAARIWWILRYWGAEDVRLLNGGWKTWAAGDFPTEADKAKPPTPSRFRAEPVAKRVATKGQVLDLLKGAKVQIVDARSEGEFCGTELGRNRRGGAIPGAKHLEWSELVDPQTHRFKSADEIASLFEKAGIDPQRPTATHCQSGGRSSVMAFSLELMGADDVSNYYKGWSEWGNAEDTPVEPGKVTR